MKVCALADNRRREIPKIFPARGFVYKQNLSWSQHQFLVSIQTEENMKNYFVLLALFALVVVAYGATVPQVNNEAFDACKKNDLFINIQFSM